MLGAATPALAGLAEQCAWPPPGGSAVHPESDMVEMAPITADLDGDGTTEIVVISFAEGDDDGAGHDGILRILRGTDCTEIATTVDVGCVSCFADAACHSLNESDDAGFLCPGCGVATGDLDDDGDLEIVAVTEGGPLDTGDRRVVVLDHLGGFVSCSEISPMAVGAIAAPVIADLDADGSPELLARTSAWALDGGLLWAQPHTGLGATTAADLDGDGLMEVLTGEAAYRFDGTLLWNRLDLRSGHPAVADFDLDCVPEVVVSSRNTQSVHVVDALTGATLASAPIPAGDCPPRIDGQGGPPTLADTDGDCVPEIGVAGCRRYALYRWDDGPPAQLTLLWETETDDSSSRFTGSSIFDLDGDGTAEVLYNDHEMFRIYDALTGAVEQQLVNSTFTLLEFPVVADVDGDGLAEVLLSANDYTVGADSGLRVIHDDAVPWAPASPLFNQHSYHVTNILPDGRIPEVEEPSWARYNSFRVQGPPLRSPFGPVIAGVPADATVDCGGVPPPAEPTASAGCGDVPSIELTESAAGGSGCGTLTRTWTATDRCGRTSSASHVITLVDDQPPVPVYSWTDVVVRCDEASPPMTTAWEDCGPLALGFDDETIDGPCAGSSVERTTHSATDGCGNATSVTRTVTRVDDVAPSLSGVPGDLALPCGSAAPPASVTASDACDPAPIVSLDETTTPGPCAGSSTLTRTWTATDACGNAITASQVITFQDAAAPSLSGVPADLTLPCGSAAPPATVTASDACDPAPVVAFAETTTPGPCAGSSTLTRTWTATDACGNAITASQVITFEDAEPPAIASVPADMTVTCASVPPPASPTATDACSTATLGFAELRIDGACPDAYRLERTWTATDDCGNVAQRSQVILVTDDGPPVFSGVPADVTVECPAVPPAAAVTATDACDPAPVITLTETRIDGSCPSEYELVRTWTAVDRCGGIAVARQVVSVVDTTPPVISGSESRCLWSPNHWIACFSADQFSPVVADACSGSVTWRLVGCASDQPEDALGDGAFLPDCSIEPDGTMCVRSERQGMIPPGRHYGILAVAVDECGNESAPSLIADVWVPRDQRTHPDCLKIQDAGAKGHGRP